MKKPMTPTEMQKKSTLVQIKKYGGKKGYKEEMTRRGLLNKKGVDKSVEKALPLVLREI